MVTGNSTEPAVGPVRSASRPSRSGYGPVICVVALLGHGLIIVATAGATAGLVVS
jgi:hypothetical protein